MWCFIKNEFVSESFDSTVKCSFKFKRKLSSFCQYSNYVPIESIFYGVKYHFITLMTSNIRLFNKSFLFFIVFGNNNNSTMISSVSKKTRQIIHNQIRTDKICNAYCSMFLCLRILYDHIRSDKNHSVTCCTFLIFRIL